MSRCQVTLVGVGLLGGSIGLALRRRGLATEVAGYVRNPRKLEEVERSGAVDRATSDLAEAFGEAGMVVLCTPPGAMPGVVREILPHCRRGTLLTDVGSVKRSVVEEVAPLAQEAGMRFVGSHPMAGGELPGVAHASASLLEGTVCVTTPSKEAPAEDRERIREFWEGLGCRVLEMDAGRHDRVVAAASHLPHVAASLLAFQVLDPEGDSLQGRLAATGFRDTTRIAAGRTGLWRDILLLNRDNIVAAVDEYMGRLSEFRQFLERGDGGQVAGILESARLRRQDWARAAGNSR